MNKSGISCIITSYNNAETLQAAVDSVLRQSHPVDEIIIADDCSTDGSQKLIRAMALKYPVIRPVFNATNLGVSANRDLAIRAARSPFVTHLDGDDLFARKKLEAEWAALDRREDAVAYSFVASWPIRRPWRLSILDPSETVCGARDAALGGLLARRGSIPRDMLLSKALYESVGGFRHDISLYEDWDLKLRLASRDVEWRHSRALGTLYIRRPGTLSRSARDRHSESMQSVARALMPVLRQRYDDITLRSLLDKSLGAEAACELTGDPVKSPEIGTRPPGHGNTPIRKMHPKLCLEALATAVRLGRIHH